jgi:uncharacterized protein (TIGR04255 family)
MNDENLPIPSAPIIEAVVDIDCDLPIGLDRIRLREAAQKALQDRYPKFQQQQIQEHVLSQQGDQPLEVQVKQGLGAMQFLTEDSKQLVQFRPNGFSFNRLAPYTSLDEYFPEIEARWRIFLELVQPLIIRRIVIRMINRILLPMDGGKVELGQYLTVPPRLPDTGSQIMFLGFLDQQMALDPVTQNHANIVKTLEQPQGDSFPIIFDIEVFHQAEIFPGDWSAIRAHLDSLRSLKNRIFRGTLTQQCLSLLSPHA